MKYPEVVKTIISQFGALRDVVAPLTLITIQGIFVATILDMALEIFKQTAKDRMKFHCSDSFLQKWLYEIMSWFEQKATLATHKLSNNWKDHCEKSLL
jgi:hypothetical protein